MESMDNVITSPLKRKLIDNLKMDNLYNGNKKVVRPLNKKKSRTVLIAPSNIVFASN